MSTKLLAAIRPLTDRVRIDATALKPVGKASFWAKDALTEDKLLTHLSGGDQRGCCPINAGESTTRCAVLDLDSHSGETSWDEMEFTAYLVINELEALGLKPLMFRSGGGNGIHLIMLWDAPQDAAAVRSTLRSALTELGFEDGTKGVAEQQIEVFPKQDAVPADGYGNYFILPLGGKSRYIDPAWGLMEDNEQAADEIDWIMSAPVAPAQNKQQDDLADLEQLIAEQPLDLTRDQIITMMKQVDVSLTDYDQWWRMGAALHHQFKGSDEGLKLFDAWSSKDTREGQYSKKAVADKWKSFGKYTGKLLTMASVVAMTSSLNQVKVVDAETGEIISGFEALLVEIKDIDDRLKLKAFCSKVKAVSPSELSDADRTMLAGALAKQPFIKNSNLTKAEVRKQLAYSPPLKANRPNYERDEFGNILNSVSNVVLALGTESEIGLRLAFDTFTASVKFTEDNGQSWVDLTDSHYVEFQIKLERLGIYRVSTDVLSKQIGYVADQNAIDSAQIWLDTLKWDGVPRIEQFYIDYFGAEDTPYTRAVGLYTWTALAGRVIRPGIQADMIPVLVGLQGVRKSTGIKALSPAPEFFSEFNFSDPENESSRKMRGTLVGELSELRGLSTREKEHIKGWVTRTHEQYRPVYREHVVTFPRRLVFFGTTNNRKFLVEDSSGQRRWLPIDVSRGEVEKIEADCLQLWAEGASVFREQKAISFKQAEYLARDEHDKFIETDAWEPLIIDWLQTRTNISHEWVTTTELGLHAIDLSGSQLNSASQRRIGAILEKLGYTHRQLTKKQSGTDERLRAYFPPEKAE